MTSSSWRGRHTTHGASLLVGALVALSAACGSTVSTAGSDGGRPGTVGDEFANEGSLDAGEESESESLDAEQLSLGEQREEGGEASDQATGRSRNFPGGPPASSGDANASSGPSDRGDAPLPAGPDVRGVTDSTIRLGVPYVDRDTAATAVNAIGGPGADDRTGSATESRRVIQTIVDHVNATGGIAQREIKPVYHFYDVSQYFTPSSRQRENQKACAAWTEDDEVFAFSSLALSEQLMLDCAEKTKTVMVAQYYHANPSQDRFESMSDYWYGPDVLLANRRERSVAKFLMNQGFFGSNPTVGIMIEDQPGIRHGVEHSLKPTLAAAGIKPAVEIVYPDFLESPWPNYVLQLQTRGVTHVLFSATTQQSFAAGLMMKFAEDQQYRPKWGGGSDTGPKNLGLAGAPAAQQANFTAMGWQPHYLDTGDDAPQSERSRACHEVIRSASTDTPSAVYEVYCDYFFFLRDAFDRAETLSPAGLAAGVARLQDDYKSTLTIGGATRFESGVHDGIAVVRAVQYNRDCDCMRYTTGPQRIPD